MILSRHCLKKYWKREALKKWRESTDASARCENALLKYYLRTWPKREPALVIMAA